MSKSHRILTNFDYSAEQRIQACFHLLVENSPDSIAHLKIGLKNDPSPIVRHECAYSLGELTYDDGYKALIKSIQEDPNHFVIHEAALALSNLGIKEGRDPLTRLLNHSDPDVVLTAKISLQRLDMKLNNQTIDDLPRSPSEIILDLSCPEEHRIQASFVLMEEGSTEAVKTLIEALHQETDPIVKHEIIFSLGETAHSMVIPHLIEEMRSDPNLFVKHEAALALGTLGNRKAEQAIRELLEHEDPDIVESAEIALERLLK